MIKKILCKSCVQEVQHISELEVFGLNIMKLDPETFYCDTVVMAGRQNHRIAGFFAKQILLEVDRARFH